MADSTKPWPQIVAEVEAEVKKAVWWARIMTLWAIAMTIAIVYLLLKTG